jgi:hypothetical protein
MSACGASSMPTPTALMDISLHASNVERHSACESQRSMSDTRSTASSLTRSTGGSARS